MFIKEIINFRRYLIILPSRNKSKQFNQSNFTEIIQLIQISRIMNNEFRYIVIQFMTQTIFLCSNHNSKLIRSQIVNFSIFIVGHKAFLISVVDPQNLEQHIILEEGSIQYLCTFSRYVNLQYMNRMKKLLGKVQIKQQHQFEKLQLAIYEINAYNLDKKQVFTRGNPSYGQEILMRSGNIIARKIVSNCFGMGNMYYYFIDNQGSKWQGHRLSQIVNLSSNIFYGYNIQIGDVNLCLPINQILSYQATSLNILPTAKYLLAKTVYINCQNNSCTGTLISNKLILTVKHIFNQRNPEIGLIAKIRLYPYSKTRRAKLISYAPQNVDLALFEVVSAEDYQFEQLDLLVDKYKICNQIGLGMKVSALGFGKYSYKDSNFNQVDLLLPTISKGYISKILALGKEVIIFKTDLHLYNGFSGCGIWWNECLVGTAIFILKNTVTSDQLNHQNFSYFFTFIDKIFLKDDKLSISGEMEAFLKDVSQINQRNYLKIKPKL